MIARAGRCYLNGLSGTARAYTVPIPPLVKYRDAQTPPKQGFSLAYPARATHFSVIVRASFGEYLDAISRKPTRC